MKYLSKKVIKGTAYYYLQYKKYTKFVGQNVPSKSEIAHFFREVAKEEYLKFPKSIRERFKYGNLKLLEALHHDYICHKNELFDGTRLNFKLQFCMLFTYHSNRQEGSKTTKKQIKAFVKSNIRKPKTKTDREIFNSFMAFEHATSPQMRWNRKHLKHVHYLLLQDLDPLIAGKWKAEDNVAPDNQATTPHSQVDQAMKTLLEWLNVQFTKKNVYPPELAIQFYCKFEFIHPFQDGNGRVGRILLNAILQKYQYPHVVFFSENQVEHNSAIKVAFEGRWTKMHKHFLAQVSKTDEAFR